MYEYLISYWGDERKFLGCDFLHTDTFISPNTPDSFPLDFPSDTRDIVISCEDLSQASLCYVVAYTIEVHHG